MRYILLALCMGGLLGCDIQRSSESLPDISNPKIDKIGPSGFIQAWQTAFDAEDFQTLSDMYEADAWLMAQEQPARKGREAIIAYLKDVRKKENLPSVRTQLEDLVINGEYSYSTTQWWFEYETDSGEIVRDAGRSFVVFKLGSDGNWRLWRAMKNQSPDIAAAPYTQED